MSKAFIIGATGGIGLALVEKFAQNGYDIVATYNKSDTKAIETICETNKVKLKTIKMDVSNFQSVEEGFKEAFSSDCIQTVVFNSGISLGEQLLCDQTAEDISKIIDVNLKGALYCNGQAQKHFIDHRMANCSIVNISSIYGIYGGACESAYSASKGGIIALTKALADECASLEVRVNAVAPGFIQTPMTSSYTDEEKNACINRTPLKRLGTPQDVANAVYFLASNDASFITGEVLTVSGGVLKF
ncbi:MAG: SDR family oxidoreductase [Clostridia bacterium]|nr:SDR family oxidoreductase [Clostridia bacterium]